MAELFQHISVSAINVLARLAAKNEVKQQLRDQGVRVTLVPARDIAIKADEHLALHLELIDEARERAQRLQLFEKPKRRRRSVT